MGGRGSIPLGIWCSKARPDSPVPWGVKSPSIPRPRRNSLSNDLLDALERSSSEGAVVLQAEGLVIEEGKARSVILQYDATLKGGVRRDHWATEYVFKGSAFELANANRFVGTFTGRHGKNADYDNPQPGIWAEGPIEKQRGAQKFPVLSKRKRPWW